MKKLFYVLIFTLPVSFLGTLPSYASSCPSWLSKDLKRAHKLSGLAAQRYKISGVFGGTPASVIGTARKRGQRCVVNILGYTLRLNKKGACVRFSFSFSGENHIALWCRNKGYVSSKGLRQSATVQRLPVARRGEVF